MVVSIPDSLVSVIDRRVRSGGFPDTDAFIADLLRSEAGAAEGVGLGEPLSIDKHFDRRLEALLDEATATRDYVEANLRGAATLDVLAEALSGILGREVLNKTGIQGTYEFNLSWTPDSASAAGDTNANGEGLSIFTAVREQLGMKLTPAIGPRGTNYNSCFFDCEKRLILISPGRKALQRRDATGAFQGDRQWPVLGDPRG